MNDRSMRTLNLVFRFILELVVLVALFLWGLSVSDQLIVLVLALGAPAIVIGVWGLFVAPKASRRLPDPHAWRSRSSSSAPACWPSWPPVSCLLAVLLAAAVALNLGLMFVGPARLLAPIGPAAPGVDSSGALGPGSDAGAGSWLVRLRIAPIEGLAVAPVRAAG